MADIDAEKRAKLEERLKLMLKKAESTTPAEAEMIMGQVEKLMLKLGIDDIMALSTLGEKKEDISSIEIAFEGVYAKSWVHMAYAVVMALGEMRGISATVYGKNWKKIGLKLIVVGYEADVKRAKVLVDSLSLQCVTATTAHMLDFNVNVWNASASDKYNQKRSFIVGFGAGAADRIKKIRKEVVQEADTATPGTFLILASRAQMVDTRFVEMFQGSTRKTAGMKIRHSGYDSGVVAGRQARTGEQEVRG